MSDSNPDKPAPDSDKERLEKLAASLPGEVVSREAAFPKKRQRPKARLPDTVRQKIETDATEEAAKDKDSDAAKSTPEKPKFKVTRSPFAPRIEQSAKSSEPIADDAGWDDEELVKPSAKEPTPPAKAPEPVAKKPEEKKPLPVEKKPEAAKPAPRPLPTKLEVTRAPTKTDKPAEPEAKPAESKPAAKEAPKPTPIPKAAEVKPTTAKPVADKPAEVKPAAKEIKPAADKPNISPIGKAPQKPAADKPAEKTAAPVKTGASPLTPAKKATGPTKLPTPAKKQATPVAKKAASPSAPKPAARPKAAPAARQQPVEEESDGVHIAWVAIDALTAVASIAFAFLVFTNMGG